jgi:abortive infection bacteriophage resistance protein
VKYAKPALSFREQLEKIKARGMIVSDDAVAIQWLKSISYYRLSAYFHPFKQADDTYEPGTDFETVRMLYGFDRKLRLILLDAIERIEVALRTALTYHIGMELGPFGHCDRGAFVYAFNHAKLMEELGDAGDESTESFVSHFRNKYTADEHLPIWMATELLSLGAVSRMYKSLRSDLHRRVARDFNSSELFLPSWIHALSYVRNLCAHHNRLWNRRLAIKPRLPNPAPWFPYLIPNNENVYCVLVIAQHLLKTVAPGATWSNKVVRLCDDYPRMPFEKMGMPPDWQKLAPWKQAG